VYLGSSYEPQPHAVAYKKSLYKQRLSLSPCNSFKTPTFGSLIKTAFIILIVALVKQWSTVSIGSPSFLLASFYKSAKDLS